MTENNPAINGAQAALGGLDPLLQHRSRLGACVLLSDTSSMTFTRLRELLGETDGNLGAQLRKLEDAGYLEAKKQFEKRKPVTWYRLAGAGKRALRAHLNAMEAVIRSAKV